MLRELLRLIHELPLQMGAHRIDTCIKCSTPLRCEAAWECQSSVAVTSTSEWGAWQSTRFPGALPQAYVWTLAGSHVWRAAGTFRRQPGEGAPLGRRCESEVPPHRGGAQRCSIASFHASGRGLFARPCLAGNPRALSRSAISASPL